MYTFRELRQAFDNHNFELIDPLIDSEKLELFNSLTEPQLSQLCLPWNETLMHYTVV